jgi:DNA repair protein RadA/Sms
MPRLLSRFVCAQCAHVSPRWLGRCPECGEWNTLAEEAAPRPQARASAIGRGGDEPTPVSETPSDAGRRTMTGIGEMDRVLGGGIVDGSVTLIGGDPGIGKSTLLAQVAHSLVQSAATGMRALYVTGEESPRQIRLRCERLGALSDRLLILAATDITVVLHHIGALRPELVILDSIQTAHDPAIESAPGTVSQVRSVGAALVQAAKSCGPSVFLIGHVTKEGTLAGPRVLEHMVDAVLYFEGDRHHTYRVLRAVKNRFGATDEIGLFEMQEDGLHEVANPSAAFLAERMAGATGSAVAATMEGARPLLVEVQALVTRSYLSSPRRVVNGLDMSRAGMLLAVIEKRLGLRLGEHDVFLNVAGGVRIVEPASDLAVAVAVVSSYRDRPLRADSVWVGEVGLGGEVRSVGHLDRRLREAGRMSFAHALVPRRTARQASLAVADGPTVAEARTVSEAVDLSFER